MQGSLFSFLSSKAPKECATFRLEMYAFTVSLFNFLLTIAHVTKPLAYSIFIGSEFGIRKVLQNSRYYFHAEQWRAQVCPVTEYSISLLKSSLSDDSSGDNSSLGSNTLFTNPLALHENLFVLLCVLAEL